MSKDVNMGEQYKYSPLSLREIRLLCRLPGQDLSDDILRFQMVHASLEDNGLQFVAISYTWGVLTRRIPIFIGDQSFHVYESAHQILSRADPSIYVWIDAVCINQDDNNEKSQQLPLMGDIYSKAIGVGIWLGPAADNSDFAISFIGQLREVLPTMSPTNSEGYSFRAELERKTGSRKGDWKWESVYKFLERAWFTRIWVVQEVALSTGKVRFACGDSSIAWQDLLGFLESLNKYNALAFVSKANPNDDDPLSNLTPPAAIRHIGLIVALHSLKRNRSLGLETAIQFSNHCESTNPRDKIYGLYGLASVDDPEIAADYNKTAQQVYIQVTRHLMTRNCSLGLLSDAGISFERRLSSIPSWIPNLNVKRISYRLGQPSDRAYRAGGDTKPIFHWKADSDYLIIRGCLVDTVAHQTSKYSTAAEGHRNMLSNFFQEVVLLVEQNLDASDATVKDSLMRTLVADRDIHMKALGPNYMDLFNAFVKYQEDPEIYREGFTYRGLKGVDPLMDEIHRIASDAQEYKNPTVNCLPQRRFCITKDGRMGLIPSDSQVGDIIGIFQGATVPFILRKTQPVDEERSEVVSNHESLILVGESYVHGLMSGEGLKLAKHCDLVIQ
ncbi:HET-domain-containing protein [Stipitochalara longipes BDJ]|nr:HET-domain-containing protein [Stipitochalara longipes BDJ]